PRRRCGPCALGTGCSAVGLCDAVARVLLERSPGQIPALYPQAADRGTAAGRRRDRGHAPRVPPDAVSGADFTPPRRGDGCGARSSRPDHDPLEPARLLLVSALPQLRAIATLCELFHFAHLPPAGTPPDVPLLQLHGPGSRALPFLR